MEACINYRTDTVTNGSLPELMRDCKTISLYIALGKSFVNSKTFSNFIRLTSFTYYVILYTNE